jgi:hypothetical protein
VFAFVPIAGPFTRKKENWYSDNRLFKQNFSIEELALDEPSKSALTDVVRFFSIFTATSWACFNMQVLLFIGKKHISAILFTVALC